MKICTRNESKGRVSIKVDGKKPRGWKDGDETPRVPHAATFDANGNAQVSDDTGKALVAAVSGITEGHNKVAPESTTTED